MNVYVCVKQVPDTETKIKLQNDHTCIDTAQIKWIPSPYDEFAIEEAIRIKEKKPETTITIISAGPVRVTEVIRVALAMGADKGIHIDLPEHFDNNQVAKAIGNAIRKQSQKENLILCGKEAIDDSASQVSQLLGEYLELPCINTVLKIEYKDDSLQCKREVEDGAFEIIETSLPAVISTHKGLNQPRYASLPNIIKAKKKEIKTYNATDLDILTTDKKIQYSDFQLPTQKQPGKKIPAADPKIQAKELVRQLHEEAKVV